MRNQEQMANRINVRAASLNSENSGAWSYVTGMLRTDACDILLVSPERLATDFFADTVLTSLRRGISLVVIDEAHCISDW